MRLRFFVGSDGQQNVYLDDVHLALSYVSYEWNTRTDLSVSESPHNILHAVGYINHDEQGRRIVHFDFTTKTGQCIVANNDTAVTISDLIHRPEMSIVLVLDEYKTERSSST